MKYEAILVHSPRFSVRTMCGVLGLRESGYYQWRRRREAAWERARSDAALAEKVRATFEENKCVYGYRMMVRALAKEGVGVSVYRVRRIMRQTGLFPASVRKFRPAGAGRASGRYFANVLAQNFSAERPDQSWVGDITYIKTRLGWVYLATVEDLFNREIVGYAVSKRIDSELVKRALSAALGRTGASGKGTVFHSDRGIQYASKSFQTMLRGHGLIGSMSRPGCPYDNAVAESFFSTAKRERIYRKEYEDLGEVKADLFAYIELFYNRKRMHSTLGYRTPVEFKRMYLQGIAA
jgi:putative transposase